MRVIVVGAGIMGCTSALELAARGAEVILLERAIPGAEASSAAAGILGAQAEAHESGPHFVRMLRARDAYVEAARRLCDARPEDIGYRQSGVLKLAFRPQEDEALRALVAWQRASGAKVAHLSRAEVLRVEPGASPHVAGAAYFEEDAQVEPVRLLAALSSAVRRQSIAVRSGTSVAELCIDADVCRGVLLEGGERIDADAVVLAAGSWSAQVPGAPPTARAVKPIRGQMIELEERPATLRTVLFGDGTYVVPRGDGRVVCGSTMEDVGFQRAVTVTGLKHLLDGSMQSTPNLANASFLRTWSNFRPFAPGEPLVGSSSVAGLFLATGHFRNGILLAFDTGETVARAIYGS